MLREYIMKKTLCKTTCWYVITKDRFFYDNWKKFFQLTFAKGKNSVLLKTPILSL